jgi:hypothetical protein
MQFALVTIGQDRPPGRSDQGRRKISYEPNRVTDTSPGTTDLPSAAARTTGQ